MTKGLEKAKKLTKAQIELLRETVGCCTPASHYPPARKLVELFYCQWTIGRKGYEYLDITPLGQAALQSLDTGGGGA